MFKTVDTLMAFFGEKNGDLGGGSCGFDPEYSLLENGLIDSINLLKLINYIEGKFGIKIYEEEMTPENFDTINTISMMIKRKYDKITAKYPNYEDANGFSME